MKTGSKLSVSDFSTSEDNDKPQIDKETLSEQLGMLHEACENLIKEIV